MDIPFDPQLLSSPYYLRRPNTPGSQLSLQQPIQPALQGGPINGLSMGMPMLQQAQQPPHGIPLNPPQQQLAGPQQMRVIAPPMVPGQPPVAPNSPSLRAQTKKTNRVLQLPAPLRSKANYSIPLPNDCEGLVYALEGNFDCGMEIVCDAATRLLEALTERSSQIQQAALCPPNANNPLRPLTLGGKVNQSQRLNRIKILESSWVTSGYIADAFVRSSDKYMTVIENALTSSGIDAHASDSEALKLLDFIEKSYSLEFEVVSTLVDALGKWLQIWISTGCLERPRMSETEVMSDAPKQSAQPPRQQSVIVENPPPPQPRGVGRPKLVPVISMADFVDNTVGPLVLSHMKPASKPKVFFKIVRLILRVLKLSIRIFEASKIAANCLEDQLKREVQDGSLPAFPIEMSMGLDNDISNASSQIHSDHLIDPETGHSILQAEAAWEKIASDIFIDVELRELFLETVKEAEFLIWRENRRSSSSIEMTTSANIQTTDRGRIGNELEAKDITVTYPIINLNNQIMCESLSCITALLKVGDVILIGDRTLAHETVYSILELWDICTSPNRGGLDSQAPLVLPALFKSTGLHIFSVLLTFGRDYLHVIRGLLGEDQQMKTELLLVLCHIASHVMLSFGRFVVNQLFPSVPSSLRYVLNQLAPPSSPDLPMDVQTCKSAVVMALICLEELSENSNWSKLWYGLLFSAYGSAVVLGRIKGMVSTRKCDRPNSTNDLRTIDQLLKILPEALREKTCHLMKQKAPQISGKIPCVVASTMRSETHRDDDLDSSLQSQDASYLLTSTTAVATGPIDTYDESIDVPSAQTEIFQDILYACTNAFVGLSKENPQYAQFLRQNLLILEEIGLLSASPIICQLVEALKHGSDPMRWEFEGIKAPRPAYILQGEQLNT